MWKERTPFCNDRTCGGLDCSNCYGGGDYWDGPGNPDDFDPTEDLFPEDEWPDEKHYAWDPKADDLISDF